MPDINFSSTEFRETNYNAKQNVKVRPCRSCGSQLEFDIGLQTLACPSCGRTEDILHEPDAAVREQPMEALAIHRAMQDAELTHAEHEKEVVCQNCGGHTTFIGTLTSSRCPYCATPLQRDDVHEAPDRLSVDGILPFVITEEKASDLLKQWVDRRWFAPTEFKKYSNNGSFSSVYAAYFTFDAETMTQYQGQQGRTRTVTTGSGNNRRTRTVTDWYSVSGQVSNSFDDLTILANDGFDAKYVRALEPWPTDHLHPYHADYVAGHLCRTYDRDATECWPEARSRMDQRIETTIRRDIGGDKQRINNKMVHIGQSSYKHVLLPIWLLTVIYNGEPWQVFMNGATGEVHGQRPWSQVKIAAAIAVVVTIIIILSVLYAAAKT